jgi:hypothetical protein
MFSHCTQSHCVQFLWRLYPRSASRGGLYPPCAGGSESAFVLKLDIVERIIERAFTTVKYDLTIYRFRYWPVGQVERPSLWSKSSWLQIQRSGFDSRCYQIFWEEVALERSPLSLVSTIDELLERESSDSGLKIREYGCRDPSRWPCGILYQKKLALISPTSGARSPNIVHLGTQATELSFF